MYVIIINNNLLIIKLYTLCKSEVVEYTDKTDVTKMTPGIWLVFGE